MVSLSLGSKLEVDPQIIFLAQKMKLRIRLKIKNVLTTFFRNKLMFIKRLNCVAREDVF